MIAEIVTVGEELLLGSTVNTNAAWLGDRLDRLGFRTRRVVTVGDDREAISAAVESSIGTSDLVVITGGLGPTHDDVTKKALAALLGVDLVIDPVVEEELRVRFERRGRPFTAGRRSMATKPEGFEAFSNPVGTAPGLFFVREGVRRCGFLVLPGVPYEMKAIVDTFADEIGRRLSLGVKRLHRTFLTAGITENRLEEIVQDLIETRHPDVRFALLPDAKSGVRLRVSVDSKDAAEAKKHLDTVSEGVSQRLGTLVYGFDDDVLEDVLGRLLRESGLTLALAESCTGGLIADRITDVAGSSDYFKGCVVAYDNSVKMSLLGVSQETLERHGAVSSEVAVEMAAGCRKRLGAEIGVSATGIAGPGGGTPDKPVGTVYLGLSTPDKELAIKLHLTENRSLNKMLTSTAALNLVRRFVLKYD
ncbi:MAG TPA: competence/damage-inducible protein A [Rhodothermales bacterium]|nr:competence/damage-inducible protein A [Rhodothermales bacterium]